MIITGLRIDRYTMRFEPRYKSEERQVGQLEIYDEYASGRRDRKFRGTTTSGDGKQSMMFLVVTTDEGVEGRCGPVEYRAELLTVMDHILPHVVGRDPLEIRTTWDILSRVDRHSRNGVMMMGQSAVDIAMWDLKGKILGQPVYKLLGGGRNRLRAYVSALGFSHEKGRIRERALMIKEMGVAAQKWFFRYGPADGAEGIRKNLEMAFTVRETLGDDYELMFDCWMGWSLSYARTMLRELEVVNPVWVEEVLRTQMVDGYQKLRDITNIPLASGEHMYNRMEINPYLRDRVFDVMQADPVWCGGITEALRIGDLCDMYGITYVPHGHSLMPAMHIVASMPPDISPYCEYLLNSIDRKCACFRQNPLTSDGWLVLNDTPGLGEELDEERLVATEVIKGFNF